MDTADAPRKTGRFGLIALIIAGVVAVSVAVVWVVVAVLQPQSSLESPMPAGTAVTHEGRDGRYEVAFGKVDWDAWPRIQERNSFNPEADEGFRYIMVEVTMTNRGDGPIPATSPFLWREVEFVVDGRGYGAGILLVLPDGLDAGGDLYPGASATGTMAFEIPADATSGVWAVGGEQFVAVE